MTITIPQVTCPSNGNVKLRFDTDAEDSYLDDHVGLGETEFSHTIVQRSQLRIGIYTLTLNPSLGIDNLQVGKTINFKFKILEKEKERFSFDIPIEITEPIPETPKGPPGPRRPRRPNIPFTRTAKSDPTSDQSQGLIDPPTFKPISREKSKRKWERFFAGNDTRGAFVEISSDNKVTIWVNISHPSLVQYQLRNPDLTKKRLIDKYVHYIGFQTYALFLIMEGKKIKYPDDYSMKKLMEATSDALAFFGLGYGDAAR